MTALRRLPGLETTPAAAYFALRSRLIDPSVTRIEVSERMRPAFWLWYAERLRGRGAVTVRTVTGAGPGFPEPTGQVALWHSSGLGSSCTRDRIAHLEPEILRYQEFAAEVEPHRSGAPLPFVLAVLSAHLGHSFGYLGAVHDLPFVLAGGSRGEPADAVAEFIDGWNDHQGGHRMRVLPGRLTRDRLLAALPPGAERELSSCERRLTGWCGDCERCFVSFYAAKAVRRPLGFRLTERIFDELYEKRYRTYLATEFADDPGGPARFCAYLQMAYGIVFDRAADTA
ncbi:hypothetical protein IPZ64_02425 [Streptomyces violaceoruber]|uniref:hypothetical protein n=1 Tax=Streptomyces violaceoruber TaxID=1935 RepID=UPI001F287A50|nr:hypothetical protein [Streptomyces violaceoruber]MCF3165791.1 hypothetical protein [Streptomyces violaceoruber]